MRLVVFNGSPRGATGNTKVIVEWFLVGFSQNPGHEYEIAYLNQVSDQDRFVNLFTGADAVLIAFPLYADSMPGIVKTFIESLQDCQGRERLPKMAFLVQSGFPEGVHSTYVEKYLQKLTRRLGVEYLGTIIKGNCEGIRLMPPQMTEKLSRTFSTLGATFSRTGTLDREIIHQLQKPLRFPGFFIIFYWLLKLIGITDLYWNGMLKENKAYVKRFNRPFSLR